MTNQKLDTYVIDSYEDENFAAQHLLLEEYINLEGDESQKRHLRKEFCSELVELPAKLQKKLLENQSDKSLKRLIQTLSKFKSPDTGYLYHKEEIELVEMVLAKRETFKQTPLSNKEIQEILSDIDIYLGE